MGFVLTAVLLVGVFLLSLSLYITAATLFGNSGRACSAQESSRSAHDAQRARLEADAVYELPPYRSVFVADYDPRDVTYRRNWRPAHVFVVYGEDAEGKSALYTLRGNSVDELRASACGGVRPEAPFTERPEGDVAASVKIEGVDASETAAMVAAAVEAACGIVPGQFGGRNCVLYQYLGRRAVGVVREVIPGAGRRAVTAPLVLEFDPDTGSVTVGEVETMGLDMLLPDGSYGVFNNPNVTVGRIVDFDSVHAGYPLRILGPSSQTSGSTGSVLDPLLFLAKGVVGRSVVKHHREASFSPAVNALLRDAQALFEHAPRQSTFEWVSPPAVNAALNPNVTRVPQHLDATLVYEVTLREAGGGENSPVITTEFEVSVAAAANATAAGGITGDRGITVAKSVPHDSGVINLELSIAFPPRNLVITAVTPSEELAEIHAEFGDMAYFFDLTGYATEWNAVVRGAPSRSAPLGSTLTVSGSTLIRTKY